MTIWSGAGFQTRAIGALEPEQPLQYAPNDLRDMELPADWNTTTDFSLSEGNTTYLPPLPRSLSGLFVIKNHLRALPALPEHLLRLNVSHNDLQELPKCPEHLQLLIADHNRLEKLPDRLPNTLEKLKLAFNQLESIPPLDRTIITSLGISNNRLKSLPTLPPTLESLGCAHNTITEIRNLPRNLEVLVCRDNPLRVFQIENLISIKTLIASNCGLREIPLLPEYGPHERHREGEDSRTYYFDGNPLTPEFQAIYDRYLATGGPFQTTGGVWVNRRPGSTRQFRLEVLEEHRRMIAQRRKNVESIQQVLKGRKGPFSNTGPANLIASFITGVPGSAEQQRLALLKRQEELRAVPRGTTEAARARIADVAVMPGPLEGDEAYLQARARLYGLEPEELAEARERLLENDEENNENNGGNNDDNDDNDNNDNNDNNGNEQAIPQNPEENNVIEALQNENEREIDQILANMGRLLPNDINEAERRRRARLVLDLRRERQRGGTRKKQKERKNTTRKRVNN